MEEIIFKVESKLLTLKLAIEDSILSRKIIKMAIVSIQKFIKAEINPFIEFSLIENIFIDVVIGEYLRLLEVANIGIDLEEAIKTIKEGDTSITYFEKKENRLNIVSNYFLEKKRMLYNFKAICW